MPRPSSSSCARSGWVSRAQAAQPLPETPLPPGRGCERRKARTGEGWRCGSGVLSHAQVLSKAYIKTHRPVQLLGKDECTAKLRFASPERRNNARASPKPVRGSIREPFAVPATRNGVSRYARPDLKTALMLAQRHPTPARASRRSHPLPGGRGVPGSGPPYLTRVRATSATGAMTRGTFSTFTDDVSRPKYWSSEAMNCLM